MVFLLTCRRQGVSLQKKPRGQTALALNRGKQMSERVCRRGHIGEIYELVWQAVDDKDAETIAAKPEEAGIGLYYCGECPNGPAAYFDESPEDYVDYLRNLQEAAAEARYDAMRDR